MSARIPEPAALAQRFITSLAQQRFVAADGTPVTLDPTAPSTFEQQLAVLSGLTSYELYLFAQSLLLELMPTTATENGLLPQHSAIWKTPRVSAQPAVGRIVVTASASLSASVVLGKGSVVTADGSVQWSTDVSASIAPGATVTIPATCTVGGTTGNLIGNTTLGLVMPVAGITQIAVDQDGFAGGADLEPVESWRARILASIRTPPGSGTAADYERWARQAGAQIVLVQAGYMGPGTVGIVVEMVPGQTPTAAQIAVIQTAINQQAPLRANATVVPAQAVPQDLSIRLALDTAANRQAVQAALAPFFIGLGIGALVSVEAIQATIYQAVGGSNVLVRPTADRSLSAPQRPVLGTITWVTS